MHRAATLFAIAVLLTACGQEQAAQGPGNDTMTGQAEDSAPAAESVGLSAAVDKAALVEEAKAAVKALAMPLQAQLKAALQSAGPVGALDVCKIVAPQLAESVSAEHGMSVTRVSLKNRNPVMGVANAWQTVVLQDFETRKAAGEDPKTLSYAEVVDKEFRFMKAVPTNAVCLNCHGEQLKPEVAAKLKELYPNDKATGFREGDIRGAFVVTKALSQ